MSESYDDYLVRAAIAERIIEDKEARKNFRTEVWITKDGQEIPFKDMADNHVFNAYRYSQDELLFREMVLRLFETRIKGALS
tara:strand:+ start:29 stop:274 length:246 start_codon:yes stop_codon:yes gene_type:complete